ncbi:MAG: TraI domain-containing protein [Gammaproteobacteria bacterium]|nr:TraI domain-containing protein [Gammaproteobacteria bacterium]
MAALFVDVAKTGLSRSKAFSERHVYPVVRSDKLLSGIHFTPILKAIREKVAGPNSFYQEYYEQLINEFAEFVQVLPARNQGGMGGLLYESLYRGLYALQAVKENAEPEDPLWNYVYFSAALLFDVAKVVEDRSVNVTNRSGEFLRRWFPYEGSMLGQVDYYRVRIGGGIPAWAGRKLTTILARQIMPDSGFKWIASKPQQLYIWLAMLVDDSRSAGKHGLILNRAHELLELLRASKDYQFDSPVEGEQALDTELADEFLDWLRDGLLNENLSVNKKDGDIYMTEDGLFLSDDVFEEYCKERSLEDSSEDLKGKVAALGIITEISVVCDVAEKNNVAGGQKHAADSTRKAASMFGRQVVANSFDRGLKQGDVLAKNGSLVSSIDSILQIVGNNVPAINDSVHVANSAEKNPYPTPVVDELAFADAY